MKNPLSLIQAIKMIEAIMYKDVTAIQFEDGSGRAFNYCLDGGEWKFVRL